MNDIERLREHGWSVATNAADEIERLQAENARLRAALVRARQDLGDWALYADAYSRTKYDVLSDLAAIDAALKGEE